MRKNSDGIWEYTPEEKIKNAKRLENFKGKNIQKGDKVIRRRKHDTALTIFELNLLRKLEEKDNQ